MRVHFLFLLFSSISHAQVVGNLKSINPLCGNKAQVFVSQGKTLLYQIEVPVNGRFEVRLPVGEYELVAFDSKGCFAQNAIQFRGNQIEATLNVMLPDGKNSRDPAGWCPQCNYGGPMMVPMINPMMSMFSRGGYWGGFCGSYYSNCMSPCAWGGFGCAGSMYPGGMGPIAMGKPNIYLNGPDRKNLFFKIDPRLHDTLLATAPAHFEKGWRFDLENNMLKIGDASYGHLYYDARAGSEFVQIEKGLCGDHQMILDWMQETLELYQFPQVARTDFKEYWEVKLPRLSRLCVFPQSTEILNKGFPISSEGADVQWTRLLFLVVPRTESSERIPAAIKKYFHDPQKTWTPDVTHKRRAGAVQAFEWGIAFPIH